MLTCALVNSPVTIFLMVLALILVVPLVLQRLRIPYVIGLILAGVAVGPHGFDLLARDMSFEVFGQVGLLYLMFLAGLEIDRYHLKKNLRAGAIFGALTFAVPLVMGAAVSLLVLGMGWAASLMMASMFSAHTLLAYPIVSRFELTRSRAVVIAVAGTIFAVLGSLVVLAAVGSGVRTGVFNVSSALLLLGLIVAFCGTVWLVYPPVTRWFFRHTGDGVTQFIYILAMTFLAAAVARAIGIEGVFGAFFGGLVLNRFVPRRSPLMSRLEFVGNAIFIPYFLIGVGMLIDVRAVASGWDTLWVAAVISAVAMFSKWVTARLARLMFGLSSPGGSVVYQLTNAHTAVALAVVTIGHSLGLFDTVVINATVIMILVTCTVSSVGTERASRRLKLRLLKGAAEAEEGGLGSGPSRGAMLISLHNPATVRGLVELALLMRGRTSTRAYALNVRGDNSPTTLSNTRSTLEAAERVAAAGNAALEPVERFDHNVVGGVLNTLAEKEIDEVILGIHTRSAFVLDTFLGPKTAQLVASTSKMVTISRCFLPFNTLRRIVVFAPARAEWETGFGRWVDAAASLAAGLGCPVEWHGSAETLGRVRALVERADYGIDCEWIASAAPADDFILLSNTLADDDLLVAVTARRASVSFEAGMDEWPSLLQRYFGRCNLLLIYPEQFGEGQAPEESMASALAPDFTAAPVPWLRRLASLFHAH